MAAIIGGAVGSSIPNIFGGFAPFPNTIATALLAYQSEAIGFGFGIKFQYSKRKIGALTNAEFNAMTPIDVGNIVEAHNTELINRMKLEMPKWLDIQLAFIEASVEVEIAKANRTPSAWAEIITAFSGAAGQQIADSLNTLDPTALGALLAANPILALIYSFANTNGGTTPSPLPDTPPFTPLPPHVGPEEIPFHAIEEHEQSDAQQAIIDSQKQVKVLKISYNELNGSGSFTTPSLNHEQHHVFVTTLQNATNAQFLDITGTSVTNTGKINAVFEYKKRLTQVYLH